jgi:hypothetical protein
VLLQSPTRSRRSIVLALAGSLTAAACASVRLPTPEVRESARTATYYSARLSVGSNGPRGRLRATVLAAFARPGSLRIELPGPGGARLVVVAAGGQLVAVFPGERAVFEGRSTAEDVEAVLGVALTPEEIMDLLVGIPGPRIADARITWGERFPRRVSGRLADGTSLVVKTQAIETPARLPEMAFSAPPHAAYRSIDADEARNMWVRR